jgi:hypothetical protein
MLKNEQTVRAYEDLAHIYDRQGQPKLRDWFLVLAADAAFTSGRETEAERLRIQLLSYNPHHLLKPFVSFVEALRSPDIQSYIADLRRTYPPEAAEQLLETHRPGSSPAPSAEDVPAVPVTSHQAGPFSGFESPPEEPPIYRMANGSQENRPAAPPPRPAATRPGTAAARSSSAAATASAHSAPSRPKPAPRMPSQPLRDWSRQSPIDAGDELAHAGRLGRIEVKPAGRWVASLLYVLVLLSSLALTVYTIARPFLPEEWLQR